MTEMMMALGGYRFGIGTAAYQTMRRAAEYRWSEQKRIGRRSAMQYVGPGVETIDFDGVIHPHFRGGLGQIDAMRREASSGEPLMLVSGSGYGLGRWVIVSIEQTDTVFLPGGAPRKVEFRLSLRSYADDFEQGGEGRV
ncbi:MAG: phage tail protein [Alphaproteobacteria bacterium]|nr:phage tail protein [Alphaproteobacteria bacterium]